MKSNLYRSEENVWKCLHNSSDVRQEFSHLCVSESPYKINKLTFVYLKKVSSFRKGKPIFSFQNEVTLSYKPS